VYRDHAKEVMIKIAQDLRKRETTAEQRLWTALRNRQLDGLKFRRQHPIGDTAYVVDFLCYECRLAIELDGGIHDFQQQDDSDRQAAIESLDYHVIRFTNVQVQNDLESVLQSILKTARTLPHRGDTR
jgi:very-short-patch-repair endonuclease